LAQMELYRKHKVSLTGSCWTMLLQMPIFMGLYYCLQESIHFRLAPFWDGFQLPWAFSAWLQNLAAPDMLFPWWWMPVVSGAATREWPILGILFLGPYFNLLPVIAACLMMVVQKMMMPPPTTEQEEIQRSMMKYMPVIMCLIFFKFASGLAVYFIVSSLWGLVERKLLLPKRHPDHPAGQGQQPPAEKKEEKPSIFAKALESLNTLKKPQETAPAGMPAAPPPGDSRPQDQPPGGKRKNRKQRKRDRHKGRKQGDGPGPAPNGAGGSGPGLMDKLRAWVKDVLKKAEKR